MTRNNDLNRRFLFFFEQESKGKPDGFHLKKMRNSESEPILDPAQLPIPDQDHLRYQADQERYLKTGKRDADLIRAAMIRAGVNPEKGPGNLLDFGCFNARVIRWFPDWAQHGETWGVDLNAAMIFWCHQNLSPPFYFSVSSTVPKLQFEDHFFSAILATSVFTHIDDLYLSWICEMRRILRPGGLFYFTFHDEATAQIEEQYNSAPHQKRMRSPAYLEFLDQESDYCATHRDWRSLTSFRREYLIDHLENYFDVVEVVERAMGLAQTALLLRRR